MASGADWNAGLYDRFRDLRLIPAKHLAAALPELPEGDIIDLGCGTGAAAPVLRGRFPDRAMTGVDMSPAMLERAAGLYDTLEEADVATWQAKAPPALIFSNAVFNWLPDHAGLIARLRAQLAVGGVLALQMPRQYGAPSHALLHEVSAREFPDLFDLTDWTPPVAPAETYLGMGAYYAWETDYLQILPAVEQGHPVRHFTQSTAARPILERLTPDQTVQFLNAYDSALHAAYPLRGDGSALMPFKRVFALFSDVQE